MYYNKRDKWLKENLGDVGIILVGMAIGNAILALIKMIF